MSDLKQAKDSLDFCSLELNKYQSLSRSGLTREELLTIDKIIVRLKTRIRNLRSILDGHR
ncbi:hypothetical protein ABGS66_08810 [Acinetobacter haemolyticus]|uniref:hypothetical protein n=1 Tax=Acinetobacter haemolyticus TaxID=29430 RepID=UPI0013735049|nr:hypothetical protein [Acinetobacter haemolyticus]